MICISLRRALSARLSIAVTVLSWKRTSPEVGSMRRRMDRPVVDLPHPDSPTRPRVSPAMMVKVTSSTACTRATSFENSPPRMGKYFLRFLTVKSSAMAASVQEAGHLVARPDFLEWRSVLEVQGLGVRAPRREAATGLLRPAQRGDHTGDRLKASALHGSQVDAGDGSQQSLRIGVERLLEQFLG